jgi:hypothetical protein
MGHLIPASRVFARVARPGAVLTAVVLLAGCGTPGAGKLVCPSAAPVRDLEAIAQLRPGGHQAKDVLAGARLLTPSLTCDFDKNMIVATVEVPIKGFRSDAGVKPDQFSYFVAVATADRRILSKQVLNVPVAFGSGETSQSVTDSVTVRIPAARKGEGGDYAILLGFQLTPEQLEFNRKPKTP